MAAISAREREAHALMAQSRIRYIFLQSDCCVKTKKRWKLQKNNYHTSLNFFVAMGLPLWCSGYHVRLTRERSEVRALLGVV